MKLKRGQILKPGAKIVARKINDEEKKLIQKTIKEQEAILKLKEVDPETLRMIINI